MKLYKYILISVFMFAATGLFAQDYNECVGNSCGPSVAASSVNRNTLRNYIKNIALEDYDKEVLQNGKNLVVVYITKTGCEACEKFKEDYFNEMAEKYTLKGVKFVGINFEFVMKANNKKSFDQSSSAFLRSHAKELAQWQSVSLATPAIMLVKNGEIINIHSQGKYSNGVSRVSYAVVADKIEENIKNSL